MARNQHAGPSTLRNRNRVTNKTRLKVIKESIDADPIVLDEDEEKARVVSTAGVDAEDANEHHLQAVLSAAATRHQVNRATRGAPEKEAPSAAYIPTPDSTGKVDNYEELYPPNQWLDPVTYNKTSETIEEATTFSLSGGFIYYMDERDKEWLDKNNEEARGEGTSAQGAISGTSTRSGRSAKAKGKDPEITPAVAMTEDEFELVMAIFEKVTHEKTEFLHHGLEQGSPFPPFSDYQDTFSVPFPETMFAIYAVPQWIPEPVQMLRYARVVYPYWRERRIERNGHPIIPVVNLDETDTKNESYICFRRRESKAVRKTRTQQATYSDKMVRLQSELATAMELASSVLQREGLKKDHAVHTKLTWERRFALVDLKRKFPALGNPGDEELFQDREKPPKRVKTDATGRSIKVRPPMGDSGTPVTMEPIMRPKDRHAMIQAQIDQDLAKRKERDHGWDDAVDNPYQPSPVPYSSRLFKVIAASRSSLSNLSGDVKRSERQPRAVRMRVGRGGRSFLDRRDFRPRSASSRLSQSSDEESEGAKEILMKLDERWRFDDDDGPAVGPEGSDEQDRELVDDYNPAYLRFQMALLKEQDLEGMVTEGLHTLPSFMSLRQGMQPPMLRREYQRPGAIANAPGLVGLRHSSASLSSPGATNGVAPPQIKNMPPHVAVPQMRISSGGGIRPPGTPVVPSLPLQSSPTQHSPQTPTINGTNMQDNNTTPSSREQDGKATPVSVSPVQTEVGAQPDLQTAATVPITSPVRKPQTPTMTAIPNGFTIPSVSNYNIANGPYLHHPGRNGLSTQQMQNIKSAFANLPTNPDGTLQTNSAPISMRTPATYIGHRVPTGNYSAQIAAAQRQMQWVAAVAAVEQQQARANVPITDSNGADLNGATTLSPQGAPARVPSANGQRPMSLNRTLPATPVLAQALTATQGRASPANGHIARLNPHSPSSHMLTPVISATQPHSSPTRPAQPPIPSPSLQSRQAVGSSGAGY